MSVNPKTFLIQVNKKLLYALYKLKEPITMTEAHRIGGLSFSQTNILLHLFDEHKIVSLTKKGRVKLVNMTSKGREISELLLLIDKKVTTNE